MNTLGNTTMKSALVTVMINGKLSRQGLCSFAKGSEPNGLGIETSAFRHLGD
jgi:hypothetical protein